MTSMTDDTNGMIKLQPKDGAALPVTIKAARCSNVLSEMLDTLGTDGLNEQVLPLHQVDKKTLEKVIEYIEHHKDDPPLQEENELTKNGDFKLLDTWDFLYLKVEENMIYQLTEAANFLHIAGLLEITTTVIANMLRFKTPEQCRVQYGIVNDFTKKQVDQIVEENKWCDEK